jgi:hypothetical protein
MRSVSKAQAVALAAGLSGALAAGSASAQTTKNPSPLDQNVISDYGETETPRSAGMGGALRALGSGTSSVFLNPAAMGSARLYHVDAISSFTPETKRWLLGGVVIDSITSRLAGSFAVVGTPMAMDPDGIRRSFLDLRLGLAYPITDHFIIGLSGRYLKARQAGIAQSTYGFGAGDKVSGGLVDPSSTPTDGSPQDRFALVSAFSFDAGIMVKPTDNIFITAFGQNLAYAKNGFLPLIAGGAFGYGNDFFGIEVDGLADMTSWGKPTARIMGGAEYKIAGMVPVRAGYRYDQGAKLNTISLGSGYVSDLFAVEASVARTASSPGTTTIFVGLSYFLESSGLTRSTVPSEGSTQQVAQ